MNKIGVYYHSNCYDGFGSAWAFHQTGIKADYFPVSYDKVPKDITGYKKIYILDFCFPRTQLLELADKMKVVLLDHHKTAKENLAGLAHPNLEIIFDMERSGAMIAWNYFFPETAAPSLIEHIQDRDLWRFKLDGSKEVHAALLSYPFDFDVWDGLDVSQLKSDGIALTRMYAQLVEKICSHSWFGHIDGHEVPIVNTSIAWSEVGSYLVHKYPTHPFACSFTEHEDHYQWSLRSREPDGMDVSSVAKKFGGGGHRNSAGFNIPKKGKVILVPK